MISQIFVLSALAAVAFANQDHEPTHHAPQPYKFGYSVKDKHGEQHREEVGDGKNVKGSYGFTDDKGIHRQVNYVADHAGFRAQVKTNEPGTANQNPAAVHVISNAPYGQGGYSGGLGQGGNSGGLGQGGYSGGLGQGGYSGDFGQGGYSGGLGQGGYAGGLGQGYAGIGGAGGVGAAGLGYGNADLGAGGLGNTGLGGYGGLGNGAFDGLEYARYGY